VQQRMPSCEIHTFDFTDYERRIPLDLNISNHVWGLKPLYQTDLTNGNFLDRIWEREPPRGVFKTIQETVIKLGHVNRPIDLF
jgi:hypothetical protein